MEQTKKNLMAMGFYDIKLYVRPFGTHIVEHQEGSFQNFQILENFDNAQIIIKKKT